ncbi:class I SAM-dependent methyltransferase [Streptomyces sp. NBC_01136]|uniref:methyltransferase domain-containing protein n=1 Tax=unclassified Streptomyces TaxID=2593676 RepID=UPI0032434B01|nr:class I SAM-dependent methyltransferase [Streptomyces sp. NBC_01136]
MDLAAGAPPVRPAHHGPRDPAGALRRPALDVGCGPGRLRRAFLRQGIFAVGIDVTPRAVARTIALGGDPRQ